MRIVFWQNILSPHWSATIRALAERTREVVLVAAEGMSADRKTQGWDIPNFGRRQIVLSPTRADIRDIVHNGDGGSVHLIGGMRWTAMGDAVIRQCLRASARFGIISEAANDAGWKGLLRRVRYGGERIRAGRRFDFILAMGQLGVCWFRRCGYDAQRVFPYAYVTESAATPSDDRSASGAYRILFLGQVVPRKGLDILCRSLGQLQETNWTLTVVGDGPQRSQLQALAKQLRIASRIQWQGTLANRAAIGQIEQSDLLVLPSRFDGWGAVVNEARLRGVPVICSDRCGAADLLAEPWRGGVFRSGDAADLSRLLTPWIRQGYRTEPFASRIRDWSRGIEGPAVAQYLLEILDHVYHGGPRPAPPWQQRRAA